MYCLLNRSEMCRYRLTRIGTRQLRNLALLPTGIERLVERVDDSRQSYHQSPPCRPDTEKIMQVQPFQSSTPVTPNHAEWQLRHERPVEHHARNDGDGEQDTHHTQEELARQSRKPTRMQIGRASCRERVCKYV